MTKGLMRCLIIGFVSGLAAVLVSSFVLSQYSDYRAQAEMQAWRLLSEPMRQAVEGNARRSGRLDDSGRGVLTPEFGHTPPKKVEVSSAGTIILKGKRQGQLMVQIPELDAGQVTWRCFDGFGSTDACP